MPCGDITEIIKINLDNENRIASYSLNKVSCQFAVWEESLIIDWAKNRTIDEILNTSLDTFLESRSADSETDTFMLTKHFESVRQALEVLSGASQGSLSDRCVIESINHGPDGTEMTAYININMNTKNIISCRDNRLSGKKS
jgi:hypothetical protein